MERSAGTEVRKYFPIFLPQFLCVRMLTAATLRAISEALAAPLFSLDLGFRSPAGCIFKRQFNKENGELRPHPGPPILRRVTHSTAMELHNTWPG